MFLFWINIASSIKKEWEVREKKFAAFNVLEEVLGTPRGTPKNTLFHKSSHDSCHKSSYDFCHKFSQESCHKFCCDSFHKSCHVINPVTNCVTNSDMNILMNPVMSTGGGLEDFSVSPSPLLVFFWFGEYFL